MLGTARRLLESARSLLEKRVELFLIELKEERIRLFDALLLAAAAVICCLMTLVLVTFTLVVIFWENHRVLVLALLTAAYAGGAVWAYASYRSHLRKWNSFDETLGQIKKDREWLETKS